MNAAYEVVEEINHVTRLNQLITLVSPRRAVLVTPYIAMAGCGW